MGPILPALNATDLITIPNILQMYNLMIKAKGEEGRTFNSKEL